ncbi:ABC transporter substrate-binding protein [Paenibacillus sp. J31TS4]|uniref:extracellular solute-binding protein n=1 Tax=Paenibacillus sp. J31TS4 TaxID=2807195 RepID=UPI001B15ADFD|nr:extracellular solute-binding protein [Paenibacillus sp. J31TS4]GIP38427.1 ABC transporter substrate-binding protein [Paenibacillus sp. J31TS4]
MKRKTGLVIPLAAMLIVSSACSRDESKQEPGKETNKPSSNVNESGMPIVKEPVTLQFMTGRFSGNATDYNDVLIWKKYEEMTNVHINWGLVPFEGLTEKRNLALASGSYPEVFYTARLSNSDLNKYGSQGVILPLNDLIDKHMPNLKALLDQYPSIKKGLTFPDGKIYSAPTIYSPDFQLVLSNERPWIRKDWLAKLGMDMPKTTDDFYNYLKAVQSTDLNGNGKADEIPYSDPYKLSGLVNWLKGSYNIGNRGGQHQFVDVDPKSNELRFFPIDNNYKEMLQYINKLYAEKLIMQDVFSVDRGKFKSLGDAIGSAVDPDPVAEFGPSGENFAPAPVLVGPHGDHQWVYQVSPLAGMGGFSITDKAKDPAVAARWMDYFYSDEGAKLFFMGVEGVTFHQTADGPKLMDIITNNPGGLSLAEARKPYLTWGGGGYPGFVKQGYFGTDAKLPKLSEKLLEPDLAKDIWPAFTFTVDEEKRMSALAADIEKYVSEARDSFITGKTPFSEWDKYISTIKGMGLDEYMKIQKKAYDRFAAAK